MVVNNSYNTSILQQANDIRQRRNENKRNPSTLSKEVRFGSSEVIDTKSPRNMMKNFMTNFKLFCKLARIKYLIVTPFFLSAALPYVLIHAEQKFSWTIWVACLFTGFLVQILAMLCNEYYDLEADTANKTPSSLTGGSRILVDGLLPVWVAWGGAAVSALLILALQSVVPYALPWYARGRELMILATPLSWSYSGPPFHLNYHGLGEIDAAIVVAVICPMYVSVMHLPVFDTKSVLLAFINPWDADGMLLRTTLYAIAPFPLVYISRYCCLNINDMEGDKAAGKGNWAVLVGARITSRISVALQCLALLIVLDQTLEGFMPASVYLPMLLIVLPFGIYETSRLLWLMPKQDCDIPAFIARHPASKRAVVRSTWMSLMVAFALCAGWVASRIDL
ncbi:hypothetical protein SmJEL517_g03682 [Synchytrium microbalum]|uniref:Uncharacterized protein n=1 Tax=Synchytrium microbalum TaxID=1806994 RepID=A0A507C201_9FUNG|nr:uncharacterized protein SmJEL517_g03682 [Synchytrium microbalum]TPX33398.1 hypothetical protein SmJEL517_g03682 [Synchytrium microbalum]